MEPGVGERLLEWADRRGYRVGWGPGGLARQAHAEVEVRRAAGELNGRFSEDQLGSLRLPEETARPEARVVVVIRPRPAHRVLFDAGRQPLEGLLPPTYVQYEPLFEEVRRDLADHGLPRGSRVERLEIPLKALAARLGLVRYGRNNVAYAQGLGSFTQIFGYWTDAPLPSRPGSSHPEPELLPECDSCGACRDACPTGAIGDDRVLLHAERCLTWANENPGAWPDWVPPSAHACLIGCLACQIACPANPLLPVEESGVSFDAEETTAILSGPQGGRGSAWERVHAKLVALGRPSDEPVIGRNLRALIESAGRGGH